jgi:hypothetical protein
MNSMRNVSPLRSTTLWVAIGIIALVVFVFWQQAFGAGIFIGESDRLNSYLNMRLWEYDAFVHLHKVPSWNNTMFGGFPASALHWMNPGTDPIALLLRWFSRPDLFQVLGYVSITLVVAACLSAYLYFYELVKDQLAAALAGLTYGLSVMSLHRISQVDNAYFTILALPFAFFVLRRLKSTARSFVALALTLTALTYWGFLQEVAYAFFILGFYTLYRAFILWRSDSAKAIDTIFVFASASFVSILFAVPRLLGIAQEMSLLSRTSALQYYGYPELLRFFHEGVYGRTFEENRLLGNGMNVHEGLQLSSSTAAAIVVWLGVLRPQSRPELCAAILFGALFAPLIRALQFGRAIGPLSAISTSIAIWIAIFTCLTVVIYWRQVPSFLWLQTPKLNSGSRLQRVGAIMLNVASDLRPREWWETVAACCLCAIAFLLIPGLRSPLEAATLSISYKAVALLVVFILLMLLARQYPLERSKHSIKRLKYSIESLNHSLVRLKSLFRGATADQRPLDTTFHIYALILLLFAVVTVDGYRMIYELFGRVDFTHSRLSVLIIFSFSSLFCIYLNEIRSYPLFGKIGASPVRLPLLTGLLAIIFFGAMAWLVNGPAFDAPIRSMSTGLWRSGGHVLANNVVVRMAITIIVVSMLSAFSLLSPRVVRNAAGIAGISIAAWVLVETVTYAHFKVAGPQTWTFPTPFRGFNYLNVPTSVMRPPSPSELATFAADFEVEKYRAVLVGGNVKFNGSKTAYISSFWQMNSIGGYGTGVPSRLAMLPWPQGVQSLRTIEFQEGLRVDPAILALLNVKYFVEVTPDLYFNVTGGDAQEGDNTTAPQNQIHMIEGRQIRYTENPVAALPRQFLVSSVIGTSEPPTFIQRKEEPVGSNSEGAPDDHDAVIYGDHLQDLVTTSFAEGFRGGKKFDAQGPLDVQYRGDDISIKVEPSARERFVVLNMRYHPDWRVKLDYRDVRPFPTNLTMMGVLLPAGTREILLRFEPLSTRLPARLIELSAIICFLTAFVFFTRNRRARGDA